MAKELTPFIVENMTIEEIMAMGDDMLRNMDARNIARAVRTLSLAANKRIRRMANRAEVITNPKGQIVSIRERADKRGKTYGLDFNALYGYESYYQGGRFTNPFGVKNVKEKRTDKNFRNAVMAEFTRVRNFLQAPSTTIPGSVQLRQKKEKALFGETREKKMAKMLTEGKSLEEITQMIESRNDLMSDVYDAFHKWKEEYALEGSYTKDKGNQALAELGELMDNGISGEDAKERISEGFENRYKAGQEERAEKEKLRMNRLRRG